MSLKDIIESDLLSIEADLDNPKFIWKGEEFICTPGSDGTSLTLEVGGFSVSADLVVNVRKELFTNGLYPAAQEKITYNSTVYRIEIVRDDVSGAFLRLFCINANRGI